VKTGVDEQEELFSPVDLEFFEETGNEVFDIFCKTSTFGTSKYVKFINTRPSNQEKIRKLIQSGESNEEFYIREDDLTKYHGLATKSLRNMIANPQIPFQEKKPRKYMMYQKES